MISVCVPVYNASATILVFLEAIAKQQTNYAYEVVLVDDGSTDHTSDLCFQWKELHKDFPLTVVRQENAGPASARNRAATEAKGDILCFTDSDCKPMPDWLEVSASALASHPEAGAVGGTYDIANPQSELARAIHYEILWRHAGMGVFIRFAGSYNLSVRRKVFEALGGFSTKYRAASAEDNDFSYRLLKAGWKIVFEPKSKVAHHHTEQLPKYLKEQYRHGYWRAFLYGRHPDMAGPDDYTKLKDIVEIPLALCTSTIFPLSFIMPVFIWFFLLLLLALATLQFYQGIMVKRFSGKINTAYFSFVVLLRAFFRSFGFVSGLIARKADG